MNQHFFDVPFAFSGDKTSIPDPLQAGGTVSFTEGWNYNYQRNLSTDPAALPIDRSTMNWLLNQITTAIQALQLATVPEFILASQNGGVAVSYGLGAEVLWSASGNAPFQKFVSITAGNTNTPSATDVLGTTTGWQVVCDPIATSAQAAAGTNNASIMTPSLVAQQDALRALLAGNSSQVFNVGPAASATQAPQFGQINGIVGAARNLKMSVAAASSSATLTADEIVVETAVGGLRYCLANFNKTINLATTGAGGMDVGPVPTSGYVAIYAIYNPTTQTAALYAANSTSTVAGSIYSFPTGLPAGYTASALISAWPTNSSGQLTVGYQRDRQIGITSVQVLGTTSVQTSITALAIPGAIPPNAVRVSGTLASATNSTTSNTGLNVYDSPAAGAGVGAQSCAVAVGATGGITTSFYGVQISTPSSIYYNSSSSAGTPTFNIFINGYEI